jgi:hypothetical protein
VLPTAKAAGDACESACTLLLQAALAARQAWLGGAAAQASGLVRLAAAVLALERSCDSGGGGDGAAQSDTSFAQHAALLAQLTELGPQLAAAQRQVMLCKNICSCRVVSVSSSTVCPAARLKDVQSLRLLCALP